MNSAANRLQSPSRLQRFLVLVWYSLRSPKTTGVLVSVLIVVVGLRLLVPQQPGSLSGAAAWITSLPPLLQPWGDVLYGLGFARIFQSLWFWLPLGLLFLNGLVALADYFPGSWRRLQKQVPPLTWQHPLAGRAEYSIRLPEAPHEFLAVLKNELHRQNFYVYKPDLVEERLVGAARRPWAWLGVAAMYGGMVLVAMACLFSYHFSKSERLVLRPFETIESRLFGGSLELTAPAGKETGNFITYTPAGSDDSGQPFSPSSLIWRLYQPAFFHNTLAWPFAADRILTIEVRDETNRLLKLIPVQENLAPAERLNLLIPPAETPIYFSIPSTGSAVQVLPGPGQPDRVYQVQLRHGSNPAAAASIMAQAGEKVSVNGLTIMLTPNTALRVLAYRDPALVLYLISAVLILAGGGLMLWQPPLQMWLVADVRGRGGQLYGVVEKFGPVGESQSFLERLLERSYQVDQPEQNGRQVAKTMVGE